MRIPDTHDPSAMGQATEFRLSERAPVQGILIAGGAFALVMLVMVLRGVRLDPLFLLVVLVFMVGLGLFHGLRRIRATADRSVKLRIGPDGIEFPDKVAVPIPWQDIERIFAYTADGETTLHVVLRDPARFGLSPQSRWRKAVDGEGITVNLALIEDTQVSVRAAVSRFAPPHLLEGGWR